MHIFCLCFSILAVMLCWFPILSLLITIPSMIFSAIVFYKYYIGAKKENYKTGKAVVFSSFVISIFAIAISIAITSAAWGVYLYANLIG